jgi:hypothetical protein
VGGWFDQVPMAEGVTPAELSLDGRDHGRKDA